MPFKGTEIWRKRKCQQTHIVYLYRRDFVVCLVALRATNLFTYFLKLRNIVFRNWQDQVFFRGKVPVTTCWYFSGSHLGIPSRASSEYVRVDSRLSLGRVSFNRRFPRPFLTILNRYREILDPHPPSHVLRDSSWRIVDKNSRMIAFRSV